MLTNPIILLLLIGIGWAVYEYRKKNKAKPEPSVDAVMEQQEKAKKALRETALQAAKHALEIGTITKAQEAGITARMKASPTLRDVLDELIATLEANGETSQAEVVKEVDAELFKGCISERQS